MSCRRLTMAMLMGSWLPLAPVVGQEGPVTFEFSFSNPGARSMGLGGAFAGLADDATAAYANPAGLTQLIDPELSLEIRYSSYEIPFVQGGRGSGEPTGLGIDTENALRHGVSTSDGVEAPFSSIVYPVEPWSFALYRQISADFQLTSRIDGLFGLEEGELARSEDVLSHMEVKVVNTGLSAAVKLGDRLSLGLGVVFFEGRMSSFSAEYGQDDERFFESNSFAPSLLDTTYSHTTSESGFAWNAGVLWRLSSLWSVGGFYRAGPELSLRVVEVVGPFDDEKVEGTIELDDTSPLNLPDVYGLGVAFRSADGVWTASFEWKHVAYSSITSDLDPEIFEPEKIRIPDGDELHLGFEYVFAKTRPVLALRAGVWRDPAHSVEAGTAADTFEKFIFRPVDDEIHWSAGIGLAFRHFQLDLGVDLSRRTDLGSLSLIYRF